jgi:hypothetical protein
MLPNFVTVKKIYWCDLSLRAGFVKSCYENKLADFYRYKLQLYYLITLAMLQNIMTVTNPQSVTKKRKPGSTKTNRSFLGQVFNFKLGRFVVIHTPLGLYCILSSIVRTLLD